MHEAVRQVQPKTNPSGNKGRTVKQRLPSPEPELAFYRAVGNHTAQRLADADIESASPESNIPKSTIQESAISESTIQTKVQVGEVDDKYEVEADQVAEQVMRMPETATPTSNESLTTDNTFIRRKCEQDQQSESENVKKKKITKTAEPGLQLKDQGRVQAGAESEMVPGANVESRQLQSGGSAMPGSTRNFFERRFNYDFSDVRIHVGSQSELINQGLNSHAFTYANHIWLGAGQSLSNSPLLAHELAHVVQQTQPKRVTKLAGADEPVSRSAKQVQRFAPYWEPYGFTGQRNHDYILPDLGTTSNIFTEAPVPNANYLGADYDKYGRADMYKASTTVGVYFEGHHAPRYLRATRYLRNAGERMRHYRQAAPRERGGNVIRVNLAPTSVKIGELKPSHNTIEASLGPEQVDGYLAGFQLARREVNEMAALGQTSPAGETWNLTTAPMARSDITIPPKFQYPNATGQSSRPLVIKELGHRPLRPRQRVSGKVYVSESPGNRAVWSYYWIPDQRPQLSVLPRRVRNLSSDVQQFLITPLMESPVQSARQAKSAAAASVTPVMRPDRQKKLRRRVEDSFDQRRWHHYHESLTQAYSSVSRTREFDDVEFTEKAIEANDAVESSTGVNLPEVSATERRNLRTVGKIRFWTGLNSRPFGIFRRVFGRAFVRVANAYQRMRERFRERLRTRRARFSVTGLTGAAIRAAFTVIKLAGAFVVRETMGRLIESLKTGVSNKLRELIEPERIEDLQEKLQEVQELRTQIEERANQTADQIMESAFGPFLQHIEQIDHIRSIVSDIATVVNLVRWGLGLWPAFLRRR